MAQVWLLGVCAVLCLVLGADAIRCSKCVVKTPYDRCDDTCEVYGEGSGCIILTDRTARRVLKQKLDCYDEKIDRYICFPRGHIGVDGSWETRSCCSDGDFCTYISKDWDIIFA